jgi:hypothetical protein
MEPDERMEPATYGSVQGASNDDARSGRRPNARVLTGTLLA